MATGSGKTYTAVNFVYRLIKLAGARRVLFLVDRGNLGDQTLKEFQQFVTPDDGRKFTELYNVQHLQSAQLDRVSRVCISTIQRLYSMLRGEEIDAEIDERSGYELSAVAQASRLWGLKSKRRTSLLAVRIHRIRCIDGSRPGRSVSTIHLCESGDIHRPHVVGRRGDRKRITPLFSSPRLSWRR